MKIAVLLSGGVDSSVVLAMLKDQGHELTAFYLKIWLEDDMAFMGDCPWEQDLWYARAVCGQLGVPLEIISLQSEYYDRVVSYALAELRAGRTPSADIFCNQRIKFGAFYDRIDDQYDKVATGHYASIEQDGDIYRLVKGIDPVKDQTYFLSHLNQAQLSRALFPLGQYTKAQVRAMAKTYDLPTQDRKDSQGICFLGKIKYNEFVKFNLGEK
ncbi:MAG: tRNA 2-thiouridine(34) synthase MnmA, partial [Sedimentisphaerales bacterium]|nr:tRNA 2-thiouridine(34) synthase MnmA [Sedimentisphaerales bacterium]